MTAAALRLRAKRSIIAEFRAEDCRFFGLLLRYAVQLDDRHDRLFRAFVTREARFAHLLCGAGLDSVRTVARLPE